jgi:hypothetical protein
MSTYIVWAVSYNAARGTHISGGRRSYRSVGRCSAAGSQKAVISSCNTVAMSQPKQIVQLAGYRQQPPAQRVPQASPSPTRGHNCV